MSHALKRYRNAKCSNIAMFAHQFCKYQLFAKTGKLQIYSNFVAILLVVGVAINLTIFTEWEISYKTCVQHDNLASESSSTPKVCSVLTRSDVFAGPRDFHVPKRHKSAQSNRVYAVQRFIFETQSSAFAQSLHSVFSKMTF